MPYKSYKKNIKAAAVMLTAAVMLVSAPAEKCRAVALAVKSADTHQKVAALTFDDGPHAVYTDEILDILAEYGIKATFFVVGENAEKFPEIITREISEGHEIGNHTYTHPLDYSSLDGEKVLKEIQLTEEVLNSAAEYRPKLFRPPGGLCGETLTGALEHFDYKLILWSVDTRDWERPSPAKIAKTVLNNIKPGSIVLFHDYVSAKSNTPAALRIILPKLIEQGYEFVTVSELLSLTG